MATEIAPALDTVAGRGGGDEQRSLRSVLGDSAVYGISVAAVPAALLLATPLIARELDPAGFGTVDVLASVVALLTLVSLLGMDSAVGRSYFDYPAGDERRRATIRFAIALSLAVSLGVAVLLALAAIAGVAAATTNRSILAASVLIPLGSALAVARLSFLLRRQRTAYVMTAALQAVVGIGAAVGLVLAGLGPPGYFAGLAAGAVVALGFSLGLGDLIRAPGRRLDRAEIRLLLEYGLPLVPAAAATWAIFALDRALIASMRDLGEAGYYAIGSKVAAPMMLAITAFAIAWGPFIFSQSRARQRELRARALTVVVAGTGIFFLALVLFAPELVRLLGGDDFRPATRAVPGIALGWLGFAAATVLSTEFSLSRRTRVIALATVTAAAINVVLNLVLIPPFGFVGAAWATAASFMLLAAIYLVWEWRSGPVPYRLGRLAAIVGVVAMATVAALLTNDGEGAIARGVGCIAGAAVLIAVAATDRGDREDRGADEVSPP
jgi:O-antigen/teichoic acid export membrane protein